MPVWRQVWPSLSLPCAADRVYPEAIPKTAVDQSDAEHQIFRQAKLFSEIRRWTLQVNLFLTGVCVAPVVPGPLVGAALGRRCQFWLSSDSNMGYRSNCADSRVAAAESSPSLSRTN